MKGCVNHASAGDLRNRAARVRPKKRRELSEGIGEGIRGFKSATKEEKEPANVMPITAGDES